MEYVIYQSLLLLFFSLLNIQAVLGIRFVIDREECLLQDVHYVGDSVQVSFVVIQADTSWNYGEYGVDFVVKGPMDEQLHDVWDSTEDKHEFVAQKEGTYKFCFYNKSPYYETIDFDLHVGHIPYYEQHAKDDHFDPVMQQISELEEKLYTVQFEQHWLDAQTERQAILNKSMGRRLIHKTFIESATLLCASFLQVYLFRRLFEKKLSRIQV